MGNHDYIPILEWSRIRNAEHDFQRLVNPKFDYVTKLTIEDIDWLKQLPHTISLPQYNSIVVHAGHLSILPFTRLVKNVL